MKNYFDNIWLKSIGIVCFYVVLKFIFKNLLMLLNINTILALLLSDCMIFLVMISLYLLYRPSKINHFCDSIHEVVILLMMAISLGVMISFITIYVLDQRILTSFSWLEWISVVIIGPMIEEIVYRAFVFGYLRKISLYMAMIVSSLLFAVGHQGIVIMILAFFVGMLLSLIYTQYSLVETIVFHSILNMMSYCEEIAYMPLIVYCICLMVFIYCFVSVKKKVLF